MLNFHLLQLFVRIADSGSIAAGARSLDIAPSIASRQLASLERAFRTKLFTRTTRRLALTEAGKTLLEWARGITKSFEDISDELGAIQHKPSGIIRMASNDYAAVMFLPAILEKFCRKYPEIRVHLNTSNEPASLLDGVCDLALHAGRLPDINLVGRRIRQYRRILCASPAYIRRKGMPQHASDLTAHDCLVQINSERRAWSFERSGEIVSQSIDAYIEVDNFLVLRELALKGLGIIRISESFVRNELKSGTLVEIMPEYKCVYADGSIPAMWLIYADRKLLQRNRLLADFLIKELSRS